MTEECQSRGYSLDHKNRMHRLFVKKKKKEREREREKKEGSEKIHNQQRNKIIF